MNNRPIDLGPRPAPSPLATARLSGQRAAALAALRGHPGGARIAGLAEELGLHPNTVREHLDALVEDGLADRQRADPSGRGRPAWIYTASLAPADTDSADPRLRDYAGLAMSLAATLERISSDVPGDAIASGVDWGRELAASSTTEGTPQERLLALLGELGFAPDPALVPDPAPQLEPASHPDSAPQPEPGAASVRLRQCPLIDAARRYPDVICRVHLGIVRGALEVFAGADGAVPERAELIAFAEPGSCLLELRRSAAG